MVALGALKLLVNFLFESAPIEKASKRVDLSLIFEMLLVLDDSGPNSYPREQFWKRKRFSNVVVGAEVQSPDAIALLYSRGDEDEVYALQGGVATDALD